MNARAHLVLLAMASTLAGCAMDHGLGGDAGTSRSDAGPAADAGPGCPPVACADGCREVTGPDGCLACRCEPMACASDADCALARDISECCAFCATATTAAEVEADACLVRPGDPVPGACALPDCRDVACPAIDCAPPLRATCEAGACVPSYECAPDQVVFQSECAPRCEQHADCVIARDVQACCGPACGAYPRALALERPCFVADGESGADCPIAPDRCDGLGCAVMPCPDPARAVCMDDGTCAMVSGTDACPSGSSESDGRCVR